VENVVINDHYDWAFACTQGTRVRVTGSGPRMVVPEQVRVRCAAGSCSVLLGGPPMTTSR